MSAASVDLGKKTLRIEAEEKTSEKNDRPGRPWLVQHEYALNGLDDPSLPSSGRPDTGNLKQFPGQGMRFGS